MEVRRRRRNTDDVITLTSSYVIILGALSSKILTSTRLLVLPTLIPLRPLTRRLLAWSVVANQTGWGIAGLGRGVVFV
jgi:hypothetical protein